MLRWADEEIACDKQMVLFLVWSNPSNLAYAIAALKADFEIVSKAMKSPYYFETSPAMPEHCILRYADDTIRNDREFVLNHITHCVDPTGKKCSLSYEIQFISANLKNDKTLMAWAGAPHGAIAQMLPDKDFLQFLKDLPLTGISVRYIEDNQKMVFDCHAKYLVNIDIFNGRKICMETHWGKMKESEKIEWCKRMWNSINEKLPLYFRVSPAMREVLWPTEATDAFLAHAVFPVPTDVVLPDVVLPDVVLPDVVLPDVVLPDVVLPDFVPQSPPSSQCHFRKNGFWGSESVLGEQR